MYELYLNRLIDDEERSKEFLQELRNNNQLVTFLWEDSSYPFKDKLIEVAKKEYENNRIAEIYTSVARVKRNWERPWETMQHSENEFKVLLGMKGYWKKWVSEIAKDLLLLFLLETVAMFLIGASIGMVTLFGDSKFTFFEITFAVFKFLEPYLIVFILLQLLHPAFDERKALVYSIVLTSAYIFIGDKADSGTALLIVLFSLFIAHFIHTAKEEEKLAEYKPYVYYYYRD